MKYWLLVTLAAALGWMPLLAQDSAQQQLPTAPSTVKYPPPAPSSTDTPSSGSSTQPGATAPPAANPGPPAQSAGVPKDSPQSSQSNPPEAAAKSEAAVKPNQSPTGASGTSSDDSIPLIRKRVDEVNVIFTVTDKHGKFVKDLKENDFQVRDDNKPPRQIVSFSRETNLPLRVGLLIDASSSIRDRFRFEQESAAEFLAQIIRPRSDLAFVIGFDTSPVVTADFTDNTEALARGINAMRPGGGTAMYDAVYYACRDKLMKAPQNGTVRRALILISDGDDNQSRVTREEAIEMAQRAEVTIYAISTNVSGIKLRGDKVLQRMADATGGRAFFPFKVQDVAKAFTQISEVTAKPVRHLA